ncbi:hypothetical protein AK812_SmicGene28833 [Symbiodinium microadriaticum]|uniref:Uncharacterized protein n=1 Tax=Symbiodinium microadriaticum TaxID=2951 RepID=A0A1Q9D3F2_SYMMI|nr:hypothetical protein AK812_SmicGene28833 [Symbiodinium microadriaticum]
MHGKAMPKLDLLHRLWPKTAVWSVGAQNMSSYRKDRKLAPLMQEVPTSWWLRPREEENRRQILLRLVMKTTRMIVIMIVMMMMMVMMVMVIMLMAMAGDDHDWADDDDNDDGHDDRGVDGVGMDLADEGGYRAVVLILHVLWALRQVKVPA